MDNASDNSASSAGSPESTLQGERGERGIQNAQSEQGVPNEQVGQGEQGKRVRMTDRAVARIGAILEKEPQGMALRVGVDGGGCSGFQYTFDLVVEQEDRKGDDLLLARDRARVLIDNISLQFMDGAEIDFEDTVMGQSFRIHNPNAIASCGCGTSFSI